MPQEIILYLGVAMLLSMLITILWQDDFDGDFITIVMIVSILWPFFATALIFLLVFGWPIVLVIFIRKWLKRRKA